MMWLGDTSQHTRISPFQLSRWYRHNTVLPISQRKDSYQINFFMTTTLTFRLLQKYQNSSTLQILKHFQFWKPQICSHALVVMIISECIISRLGATKVFEQKISSHSRRGNIMVRNKIIWWINFLSGQHFVLITTRFNTRSHLRSIFFCIEISIVCRGRIIGSDFKAKGSRWVRKSKIIPSPIKFRMLMTIAFHSINQVRHLH